MKLEIEVEDAKVESWIKWLDDGGAFSRSASGYWLCGCSIVHKDQARIVFDCEAGSGRPSDEAVNDAHNAWKKYRQLLPHFYLLNREVAIKAYAAGVRAGGVKWWADGIAADLALQTALLGKVLYG